MTHTNWLLGDSVTAVLIGKGPLERSGVVSRSFGRRQRKRPRDFGHCQKAGGAALGAALPPGTSLLLPAHLMVQKEILSCLGGFFCLSSYGRTAQPFLTNIVQPDSIPSSCDCRMGDLNGMPIAVQRGKQILTSINQAGFLCLKVESCCAVSPAQLPFTPSVST